MRIRGTYAATVSFTVLMLANAMPAAAAGDATPMLVTGRTTTDVRHVGSWAAPELIGQLTIPAGRWSITAQATFNNATDGALAARCLLRIGTQRAGNISTDISWVSLRGHGWAPMLSHLVATTYATNGTQLTWRCSSPTGAAGDLNARHIQINAIQVGEVRTVDLNTGSKTTAGSGSPKIVTGKIRGPVNVSAGSAKSVGSMTLPTGRWLVIGKASVHNTNSEDEPGLVSRVHCSLSKGHVVSATYLNWSSSNLESQQLAWQAIVQSTRYTRTLRLECENAQPGVELRNLVLTALKVTESFTRELPTYDTSSTSAQVLWHDDERQARRQWASQDMPVGNWAMFVTGNLYGTSQVFDPEGGVIPCVIQTNTDWEGQAAAVVSSVNRFAFTMTAGFRLSGPEPYVSVDCTGAIGEGAYMGGRVAYVRIVMLRATSIWEQES